jgi:hypothetical protein
MTFANLKRYMVAAALVCAVIGTGAAPAMAQRWGHYGQHYGFFPGYAPGQAWNPVPPVGLKSHSRTARHNNCPTGTYGCY